MRSHRILLALKIKNEGEREGGGQKESQEGTNNANTNDLKRYVSSHTLWEDEDEKELTSMREDLERYVFSKIYKRYFLSQQNLFIHLSVIFVFLLLLLHFN